MYLNKRLSFWRPFGFYLINLKQIIIKKGAKLNLIEQLKRKFRLILEINFIEENGLNYLRVVTDYRSLKEVEKISIEISKFIDKIEISEKNFILEVLSKGQ
ncbi:hypothetical protein MFC_01364 [Mesomycoplasma flocculare ATCC 27716]|uniref:Ribosome maturation factor RimP N-terminal domain-containing protein n=1 Tax=Mesomycoplasma flocculare ATCC 27399 TaxID=743971 RepID=A0A0A8E8Y3_MESFC|nr:hypothetical protein MYF_02830 [Mesomycoplasma flocculare ATCC 27399]ENX51022.1 hypothetical protein MFC_01364 [Mesomycoplasma flocculare ATCC 27716]